MFADDAEPIRSLSRSGDDTTRGEDSKLLEKLRALDSRGGVSVLAGSRSSTGAGEGSSGASSSSASDLSA